MLLCCSEGHGSEKEEENHKSAGHRDPIFMNWQGNMAVAAEILLEYGEGTAVEPEILPKYGKQTAVGGIKMP